MESLIARGDTKVVDETVENRDADTGIVALEYELSFLVRRIEAVQRHRTYPLMRAHYLVLLLLERDGPQPHGYIASELNLDASTVTRQITAMVDNNLITKQDHPDDKRSAILHATEHGLEKMEQMRQARLTRVRRLFKDWDPDARCQAAAMIARLNKSLAAALDDF